MLKSTDKNEWCDALLFLLFGENIYYNRKILETIFIITSMKNVVEHPDYNHLMNYLSLIITSLPIWMLKINYFKLVIL